MRGSGRIAFLGGIAALGITLADYPSTSNLTLTTSYQDVPGCSATFTPIKASKALVIGVFDMQCSVFASSNTVIGALDVDGVDEGYGILYVVQHQYDRITASQVWVVSLSVAAHTLKLEAKKDANTNTMNVLSPASVLAYVLIPNT